MYIGATRSQPNCQKALENILAGANQSDRPDVGYLISAAACIACPLDFGSPAGKVAQTAAVLGVQHGGLGASMRGCRGVRCCGRSFPSGTNMAGKRQSAAVLLL